MDRDDPLSSGRLRIALVGTAHPMRGGLAQYNALLARELAREHDVELVSFTRQYPSLLFPGRTQMDSSEDPVRYPATPIVDSIGPWSWERAARHLAALGPEPAGSAPTASPPESERAASSSGGRPRGPDGLVFKYWMPFFAPAFGTIARRVRRRVGGGRPRVVAILDNLIPHERRPFDLALTRYFTGAVDAYIAMSDSVREDLLSIRPEADCRLVPHPVFHTFGERIEKGEARRRLGLDPEGRILLFFGFVRDYKGLDVLLDALPRIGEETGAHLWVLGEFYAGKDRTLEQIGRLGIGSRVTLRDGYVPDEQVGLYFSAADAIVLPYRSATQSGIVPIAYQLERPVICTDVGGLAEIVLDGETGLIVPPADSGALADAVRRFYDESLEPRFVPRIAEEKKRYSWERMAAAVVDCIRARPQPAPPEEPAATSGGRWP